MRYREISHRPAKIKKSQKSKILKLIKNANTRKRKFLSILPNLNLAYRSQITPACQANLDLLVLEIMSERAVFLVFFCYFLELAFEKIVFYQIKKTFILPMA